MKLGQLLANETIKTLRVCDTGEIIQPQSIREGNGPDPKEDDPLWQADHKKMLWQADHKKMLWQADHKKIMTLRRYYNKEFGEGKSHEQFLLWIEQHLEGESDA